MIVDPEVLLTKIEFITIISDTSSKLEMLETSHMHFFLWWNY